MRLKPKYRELFNEYFRLPLPQGSREDIMRKLDIVFSLIEHQILDNPKSYEEEDEQRK